MKRFILLVLVCAGAAAFAAGCSRGDFTQKVDSAAVEKALDAAGVKICIRQPLNWPVTPGFVGGAYWEVNKDCATHDSNLPGAKMWVAEFATQEARDTAAQTFQFGRRHPASSIVRTVGPWLIVVDGHQEPAVVASILQALGATGVQ